MITSARLRQLRGLDGVFTLLHELGYPVVAPVVIDPEEWRRAGIVLNWNGTSTLHLAARTRRFDLFVLQSDGNEESVATFLRSYREYNVLTKSVLIKSAGENVAIYDLAGRTLRRLDVDLAQPSVHAVDRLNLLAAGPDLPRIFDLALDRETITRRFFERFRDAVRDISGALEGPQDARDGEALLIMSRLLFLSFVQVKGWLNEERRFLFDRLDSKTLAPLFFGCLNTPLAQRDGAARKLGRIPYLNGGLFEPSPYEKRYALNLPDELLRRVIADVFERFDFSVDEGDAAGTHVDPEMLGRVFESLMADDERTASGSFYTPREIVAALTSRAVVEWVGNTRDPKVALRKLETITVLDPACGSGAFLLSALHNIERLWRELAQRAEEAVPGDLRRRIVERSLFGVDLKPEAVRLCELRLWLAIVSTTDAPIEDVAPLPNLDRNILQGNSLLSPTDFLGDSRAEIYRDWRYSIVAQADVLARYRIASRDERPALARIVRDHDHKLASELLAKAIDADERELQRLAMPDADLFGRVSSSHTERCRELQERIATTRKMLERVEDGELGFFSFDVHFAHVLAAGGFAVVAGNPPWVRNSRIDANAKRMFADRYALFRRGGGDAAFHQPDLSLAFFERAMSLTACDGVVSMLMPAKIINAGYAARLRRYVWERASIVAIDDWSNGRWFDADTFPLGLTVRPLRAPNGVAITSCGESFSMPQRELPVGDASSEWALVPPDAAAILKRLRNGHASFAEVLGRMPIMGVKTGANGTFFLEVDRISRGKLITNDGAEVPMSAVARCVRGRDVRRWSASDSVWMIWPPADGWEKPPQWLEELARIRKLQPEAFRLAYVKPEHAGIKVVWKDLARGMSAAVLPDVVNVDGRAVPLIPNQTLYSIDTSSLSEAYAIAALLNSTIVDALLLCVAERAKDAHFRYFGRTVAKIPMPRIEHDGEAWARLVRAGRRAHHEVDDVVASLYGVTPRELDVLRRFVDRRLERDAC